MSLKPRNNEDVLPPDLAEQVDEACDRFEEALKAGQRPRIEQFLGMASAPGGAALFRELLGLELDYRRRGGEIPTGEEYMARFPKHASLIDAVLSPPPGALTAVGTTVNYRRIGPAAPPGDKLPEFIGRYRVVERLGVGGQAEVFRAINPLLSQDVVIKWTLLSVPDAFRHKLLDEARILVKLNDPGLVRVYDADLHEQRPFIVMEYVSARSLDEVLKRERLPLDQAVALVADLAGTLSRVHPQGVFHRDLKPANVLIDASGKPRLIDFGLACLTQAHQEIGPPEEGVIAGTGPYMATEQAKGQGGVLGPRTDVFGLGAILYHLLTNRPPYQGETPKAVWALAREGRVIPPRQFNPRIPAALERICLKALAADPADRPASAAELEKALRDSIRRPRVWRRWLVGAGAVVVLVGLGLLLGWALNKKPEADTSFKGWIDIVMTRPGDPLRRLVRLNDPAALPLQLEDEVRVDAELHRPAYMYIVWIDTQGKLLPVYPWRDGEWSNCPATEEPRKRVSLPEKAGEAWPINPGPADLETLLLLVREAPLGKDVDLEKVLAGLGPQKLEDEHDVAWFENGLLVRNDTLRAPNLKSKPSSNPLVQLNSEIQVRLGRYFSYTRAVTFANRGGREN